MLGTTTSSGNGSPPITGTTFLRGLSSTHDLDHLRTALKYAPKRRRRIAVDVGAHCGIWTRELCKQFELVHAFEPHPELFRRLPHTKCRPHNVALGRRTIEKLSLREGTENNGQSHVVPFDERLIPIEVKTLDDYKLSRVDFLKIDVEGWETFVVEGAAETIYKWHPLIVVEENGLCQRYAVSRRAIHDQLTGMGYMLQDVCNKDYVYQHVSDVAGHPNARRAR